jgi:hypothetical protein
VGSILVRQVRHITVITPGFWLCDRIKIRQNAKAGCIQDTGTYKFSLTCNCSQSPIIVPARSPCSGEIHELKQELRTLDRKQRKGAVKKVIAAMTVGKDVSSLFPDVVNCMQTEDLELKKLVYLYLINYAKTQPDLAIMGVNTFVKVPCHSRYATVS